MDTLREVVSVLTQILNLGPRSAQFDASTPLLGAIPELDSMAVVSVITALEDHFGIEIADDDVSADTFSSVGSLADFVREKLRA
jgi:acyl carrier protein